MRAIHYVIGLTYLPLTFLRNWCKMVHSEAIYYTFAHFFNTILRWFCPLGGGGVSSRLAVQSHRHFDLTCPQGTGCFISDFSLFLGSWEWVTVLQFIVTRFFGKQSPGDANLFAILDNTFPQCKNGHKILWFSCLMCFSHSIQAFMPFQSVFILVRIKPEFFQSTSIAFQKVLIQNQDFRFFGRFF